MQNDRVINSLNQKIYREVSKQTKRKKKTITLCFQVVSLLLLLIDSSSCN